MNQSLKLWSVAAMVVVNTLSIASPFTELDAAQADYLNGNLMSMTTHLKNAFMQGLPESAKQNALELLNAAYTQDSRNSIPVDWKLPSEIRQMKVDQRRRDRVNDVGFSLKLSGNYAQKGTIKQLKLVRYPNEVILDRTANIGEWEEEVEANPVDGFYYQLETEKTPTPFSEGLYLLEIVLTNGKKTDGWFILSNTVASKAPDILVPMHNETFTTGNPVFHVPDFKSPEYDKSERRSVSLAINKIEPDQKYHEVWHFYDQELPKTAFTIGKESEATGVKSLVPGKYQFYASFREAHMFGDLRVGRQSVRLAHFTIK